MSPSFQIRYLRWGNWAVKIYLSIKKELYRKKVKFFLGESSHSCLDTYDSYQRHPWISISPNCCILCKISCFGANKPTSLGLHLSRQEFGWQITFPFDVRDILPLVFSGDLFKEKKIVCLNLMWALLWSYWLERNSSIFIDKRNKIFNLISHLLNTYPLIPIKLSSPFVVIVDQIS